MSGLAQWRGGGARTAAGGRSPGRPQGVPCRKFRASAPAARRPRTPGHPAAAWRGARGGGRGGAARRPFLGARPRPSPPPAARSSRLSGRPGSAACPRKGGVTRPARVVGTPTNTWRRLAHRSRRAALAVAGRVQQPPGRAARLGRLPTKGWRDTAGASCGNANEHLAAPRAQITPRRARRRRPRAAAASAGGPARPPAHERVA
ncbi:MAG: hypothetical protein J3K34DRAFT_279628 [Monoraphidium minutum]|nr:MAG: hypothetical protein J3K34DRAFT_279628 [Monoraphidium minutum]